ncbi:DnaJ family domain-containing protein [Oceanibium sediminis]|uniref:DnaJ family domain-containing protein n=1 Tax=Oceanibium sediminis TaxID=2026339 RepID=UPI00130049B7|nr:DnaJ family domain-containing protein [Oceanibium sediminis]
MFETMLDRAFKRALDDGVLDNLPGQGKPLDPSKLTADPFAHVFSESGVMSPFAQLQGEIDDARTRLAGATDPTQRRDIQAEISTLETRKAIEMETFNRYK